MAWVSNAGAQKILDFMLTTGFYTDWYVALWTVAPAADGTGGTEVTGFGYARQLTDPTADWTRTGQVIDNDNLIDFTGPSGGDWGDIVAYTIHSAVSGGTMIGVKELVAPRTVNDGDPCTFPAGNIQITVI